MSRLFPTASRINLLILAVLLLIVIPIGLDEFRLNLVSKYLTFSFVALGLVLCWGAGGILSLGQGVFFGLGGYRMHTCATRIRRMHCTIYAGHT